MTQRNHCRKNQKEIMTTGELQELSNGHAEPVRLENARRPWWLLVISSALGLVLLIWLVVTWTPNFYRAVASTTKDDERAAGRFVTSIAALATASRQEGSWGVDMKESEINAWLKKDLPRNHPDMLNGSAWGRLSQPRIQLEPKLTRIGIEVTTWGITAVAWAEIEVRLKAANQFALSVHRAGLGGLPLPRDAILRECGRQLSRAGMETQMQRFRDRSLLLAIIPERLAEQSHNNSAHNNSDRTKQPTRRWQIESLRIDRGSLTVAGSSRLLKQPRAVKRISP